MQSDEIPHNPERIQRAEVISEFIWRNESNEFLSVPNPFPPRVTSFRVRTHYMASLQGIKISIRCTVITMEQRIRGAIKRKATRLLVTQSCNPTTKFKRIRDHSGLK